MKAARLILFALALIGLCASPVEAHAFLDSAEPAVGSTVKGSPTEVKLWFTMHLKRGFCSVQVFSGSGAQVDKGDVKIDAQDSTLMTVSVPGLPAGTYRVIWKAVCIDGHVTHGDFTFEITSP